MDDPGEWQWNPHLDRAEYLVALERMGYDLGLPAEAWPCPLEHPLADPPGE